MRAVDLLIADGVDLRPLPLRERKLALARLGKGSHTTSMLPKRASLAGNPRWRRCALGLFSSGATTTIGDDATTIGDDAATTIGDANANTAPGSDDRGWR